MKISEITYFLPQEEERVDEILRTLLPHKANVFIDQLKEPNIFNAALHALRNAIEDGKIDNPLPHIAQEFGISSRSLQDFAQRAGVLS